MVRDGRRCADRRRSQPGPTRRERTEEAPTQFATKSGWVTTGDQGVPRRQPRLRAAGARRPTTTRAPTPSGEAARPGRHQQSGTALRAGVGHEVRCETQLATSHVGEANATDNPKTRPPAPTWDNACVLGATGWCLAPYVGVWRNRWVECSVEARQNPEKQPWHAVAG